MKKLGLVLGMLIMLTSCKKDMLNALDIGPDAESVISGNRFRYNESVVSGCEDLYVTKYDSLGSLGDGVLSTGIDTIITIIMTKREEAYIQIRFSEYKGSGNYVLSEGDVLFLVGDSEGSVFSDDMDYDKIAGYIDIVEGLDNSFKGKGSVRSHDYQVYFSFNSDLIDKFDYHNNYYE